MVDMASKKIFQAVLCPTQLFQWKLICTFNQHCLSYKISSRLQFNSSLFFWKRFETVLHWHNFFQDVPHSQKTLIIHKDQYVYLLWANDIFEGTLVIVYQKNAPLRYKTTCSESESRNFDCQWTLVSFLVKHNQFYREARLTCPLYRSTEDICIGICVFKRVFNVWHILKKSVSM